MRAGSRFRCWMRRWRLSPDKSTIQVFGETVSGELRIEWRRTIVDVMEARVESSLLALEMAQRRPAQIISTVGHAVSGWVADAAAHPLCQAGVIAFCLLWWASGLPTDILT